MYINNMGVKTISVNDEVYNILKKVKKNDESFSELIGRLVSARCISLKDYFGILCKSENIDGIDAHSRALRASAKVRQ
jgi:predicted CopG family antitoxin